MRRIRADLDVQVYVDLYVHDEEWEQAGEDAERIVEEAYRIGDYTQDGHQIVFLEVENED